MAASRKGPGPVLPDHNPLSGVIIIRTSGEVVLCTEPARTWLQQYFGARLAMGPVALPAALFDWALDRLKGEGKGRRLREVRRDPLVRSSADRCLVATLLVDHGKDLHLMRLEEFALSAPPASLAALGLTAREAEVLSWVAQGKTNREVGLILGASSRTVAKHLEHVFQKIGVESRTAAILKAWLAGGHAILGQTGYSSQQSTLNSLTTRPPSNEDM